MDHDHQHAAAVLSNGEPALFIYAVFLIEHGERQARARAPSPRAGARAIPRPQVASRAAEARGAHLDLRKAHKIANASYEVENGSKFLGKPYEPNAIIKNDMEFILMQRKPGGYRKPTNQQRQASRIEKDAFDRWFQQIWTITGASTKHHPAPFPLELATRLVRMFSFTEDTVLDPFCGSDTTTVAALRTGRNSIGVEIDPEYCRMAARYLKAETSDLFTTAELRFENAPTDTAALVKEEPALYGVRPAKKRLE